MQHWGVVVKPGERVICNPGEFYCHISQIVVLPDTGNDDVRVYVKVDVEEILLGTLSVDKFPQCTTDLYIEKEFELLHTSKTSNISVIGYKLSKPERKCDTSSEEGDESDEEVPLAIPLYSGANDNKSKETKSGAEKFAAPKPAASQSSKIKVALEEAKDPGKLKIDIGGIDNDDSDGDYVDSEADESSDDEFCNFSDEDDANNSDEDEEPSKNMGKNRPSKAPVKTPPQKKAKITPPPMGENNDDRSKETISGAKKVAAPRPAATQSSKPKIASEETKDSGKLKDDVGCSDNDDSDEDYVDSEDGESCGDKDSSDEGASETLHGDAAEYCPKIAKGRSRPAETPLKKRPEKKAKMTTPSKANNTGSGTGTGKKSGYVHVATPYPSSKQVKKIPSMNDSSRQSAGSTYACKTCSRTFNSYIAVKTHCKVKQHRAQK